MKISNILLIHFLLPISVFAAPGFYSPQSENIPSQVAKAATATYRYVSFRNEPQVIRAADYDKYIEDKNPSFLNKMRAHVVKGCKSQSLGTCEFFLAATGTAFVVGENRDRLLTVRHNLQEDVLAFEKALQNGELQRLQAHVGPDRDALFRNMLVSFVLLNADGKPVFDTRFEGDWATPIIIGLSEENDVSVEGRWKKMSNDFAYIKLSRSVGAHSLNLRETGPQKGEILYSIGFPVASWNRQILESVPNSDGTSQYVSNGVLSEIKTAFQFLFGLDYIKNPGPFDKLVQDNPHISISDAEAEPGQSGSPVVDVEGNVTGLVVAQSYQESDMNKKVYLPHNHLSLNADWLAKKIKANEK